MFAAQRAKGGRFRAMLHAGAGAPASSWSGAPPDAPREFRDPTISLGGPPRYNSQTNTHSAQIPILTKTDSLFGPRGPTRRRRVGESPDASGANSAAEPWAGSRVVTHDRGRP